MALETDVVGWVTIEEARERWADLPQDTDVAASVLMAAYEQCYAFAPAVEVAPESYAIAQIMQARATWTAFKAGRSDTIGPDGYAVQVFPLDWHVQQLLRPKRKVPVIA